MSQSLLCEPVQSGSSPPKGAPLVILDRLAGDLSQSLACEPVLSGSAPPKRAPSPVISGDAADRVASPSLSLDQEHQGIFVDTNGNPSQNSHGVRRFPCRARGVDSHNARTAYINVPPDAKHGMLLICTHPVCRSSGRKFRFCGTCQIPVAKRNFSKRHSHGQAANKEENTDDASSTQSAKRQRINSVGDAIRVLQEKKIPVIVEQDETEEIPRTVVIKAAPSTAEITATSTELNSTSTDLTDQERQWLELYRNRPTTLEDEDEFRQWMDGILETAEFKDETTTEAREDEEDFENSEHYLSVSDMQELLSEYFDIPL